MGAIVMAGADLAHATPRPLPFTYPVETLPPGSLEVEQYVDLVPVRVAREGDAGTDAVTSLRSVLQTELEYGLTDRLELGFYLQFRQGASATSPFLQFQGIKQRLKFRLSDPLTWPINVGLYGEVAEFHDEIELEEKILLSRRFGRFGLAASLWLEQEYYFQIDEWRLIYNPTLGAHVDVTPAFSLGAEYWLRGRFDEDTRNDRTTNDTPTAAHHYLGPTAMMQGEKGFLSLGAYARLDGVGESARVGDAWGKLWVRVLLGIHL